jgi:inhibitor of the pro-sigma K processing machinery
MKDAELLLGSVGVLTVLLALVLFWRALRALLGFVLRAGVGGGALAALSTLGAPFHLHLGVNAFNLVLLGLLGGPGFGLLLLLNRLLW